MERTDKWWGRQWERTLPVAARVPDPIILWLTLHIWSTQYQDTLASSSCSNNNKCILTLVYWLCNIYNDVTIHYSMTIAHVRVYCACEWSFSTGWAVVRNSALDFIHDKTAVPVDFLSAHTIDEFCWSLHLVRQQDDSLEKSSSRKDVKDKTLSEDVRYDE